MKTLLVAALVGVLGIGSAIGAPVKKHALRSHHATTALKAKAATRAVKAHHKVAARRLAVRHKLAASHHKAVAAKHKVALHSHRTAPLA